MVLCHPEKNFVPNYDVESFVKTVEKPVYHMLMVQAGPGTDTGFIPTSDKEIY